MPKNVYESQQEAVFQIAYSPDPVGHFCPHLVESDRATLPCHGRHLNKQKSENVAQSAAIRNDRIENITMKTD